MSVPRTGIVTSRFVAALARWPVVLAICGANLTLLSLRAALEKVGNPDLFWIAAAGREMQRAHDVPRSNLFSFVDGSRPWVMHEWLFALPYAWTLRALGPSGFVLWGIFFAAATTAAILVGTLGRARAPWAGAALAYGALLSTENHFLSARPTYASIAIAASLALIAFGRAFGRSHALVAVALSWAWTQAHGSFPLGLAMLGAAALERRTRWPIVAFLVAVALVPVNPYGIDLVRLVLLYARGTHGPLQEVSARVLEYRGVWQPEYFETVDGVELGALLAGGALAAYSVLRTKYRVRGALCLLLAAHGLAHARQVPVGVAVMAIALVPALDQALDRTTGGGEGDAGRPTVTQVRLGILITLVATAIASLAAFLSRSDRDDDAALDASLGGTHVPALVRKVPAGGRLYAPFRDGGLAAWVGYPSVRVLYDSRNDCYSPEVVRFALALKDGAVSEEEIRLGLVRYDVDYVLGPTEHMAREALDARFSAMGRVDAAIASHPDWEEVARDGGWVLRRRVRGPGAR